jgi:hypothetical protein
VRCRRIRCFLLPHRLAARHCGPASCAADLPACPPDRGGMAPRTTFLLTTSSDAYNRPQTQDVVQGTILFKLLRCQSLRKCKKSACESHLATDLLVPAKEGNCQQAQ